MAFSKIVLGIGIVLFIAAAMVSWREGRTVPASSPSTYSALLSIGSTTVNVALANTDATREQGLSGVTSLEDDQGMLFIFDRPGRYGFWMKDMVISLDFIWMDENYKVVEITRNVSPETYPKVFYPTGAVQHMLEVPAGFTAKNAIAVGDVAQLR